jgi:hypothetical protein
VQLQDSEEAEPETARKKRQMAKAERIAKELTSKYPDSYKCQKPCSVPIENPAEWSAAQFFHGSYTMWDYEDETPGIILQTADADLDDDGVCEKLIRNTGSRNTSVLIFKKSDDKYLYLGSVWGSGFRILPNDAKGRIRMLSYASMGGSTGYLKTFTHDGTKFELSDSELITPGDGGTEEGNRIYWSYFPPGGTDPAVLKFEKLELHIQTP